MADLLRLSDQELIRRARADVQEHRQGRMGGVMLLHDIQERTFFYTESEVAVTAELQRRGLFESDWQIKKPSKRRRSVAKGARR